MKRAGLANTTERRVGKAQRTCSSEEALRWEETLELLEQLQKGNVGVLSHCAYINDREFMIQAVSCQAAALEHASEQLQRDETFVRAVVSKNGAAFWYVLAGFRYNADIVLAAVANCGTAILSSAADEFANSKRFVMEAIAVSKRINPPAFSLDCIAATLRSDREVILAALANNWSGFRYASETLRNDREVVLTALSNPLCYPRLCDIPSETLRNDKEIVLPIVMQDGRQLQYASERLKDDREVVLTGVSNAGQALREASESLRADGEVVAKAVSRDGCALQFASKTLRADRDVVLTAVTNHGAALKI